VPANIHSGQQSLMNLSQLGNKSILRRDSEDIGDPVRGERPLALLVEAIEKRYPGNTGIKQANARESAGFVSAAAQWEIVENAYFR
jgi:hypothetical protein